MLSQIRARKKHVEDLLFLLVVLLASFGLMFYNIRLPGMFQDEAFDIDNTMQLVIFGELRSPTRKPLYLFGKAYPVMMHETMGPIYAYSIIPFYYVFGVGVVAARMMPITFGLATIVLTFQLGKTLFSRKVAYISTALLSIFPSFIQWTRIGIFGTTVLTFLTMGTLVFLFEWMKTKRPLFLLLTALFVGLGFSSKANYYWFVVNLVILYLIWRPRLRLTLSQVAFSILTFLAAAFPFVLYNCLIDPLATPRFALANLTTSMYGTSNVEFLGNLLKRMGQFVSLLEGSTFFGATGGHTLNPFYSVVFIAMAIGLALTFFGRTVDRARRKREMAICLLLVLLFLEGTYTTSGLGIHHLIIFMPFPQMIIAEALDVLPFHRLASLIRIPIKPRRGGLPKVVLVLVSILIVADLTVNIGYHQSLQRTGGVGLFSDAIYDLSDYFTDLNVSRPIAVDWGFSQLGVLTKGKVYPTEIFGYPDWSGSTDMSIFRKTAEDCLRNPDNVYLFHTPRFTNFDRFSLFQETATHMNRTLILLRTFSQRDGIPVILVYKAA